MPRRGRPLKSALPNGAITRGNTLAKIAQAERNTRQGETVIVMLQPHRRDSVDPADPWNATAIGRFLLPRKAKDPDEIRHLHDAADRYFTMYNRWQRAKSVAAAYREGNGWHGAEPTPAEIADRDLRVTILAKALERIKVRCSENDSGWWPVVHDAIVFNSELPVAQGDLIIYRILSVLAVELGMPVAKQPFIASAG